MTASRRRFGLQLEQALQPGRVDERDRTEVNIDRARDERVARSMYPVDCGEIELADHGHLDHGPRLINGDYAARFGHGSGIVSRTGAEPATAGGKNSATRRSHQRLGPGAGGGFADQDIVFEVRCSLPGMQFEPVTATVDRPAATEVVVNGLSVHAVCADLRRAPAPRRRRLTVTAYTAEPGTTSHDALALLASWAATPEGDSAHVRNAEHS